MMRYNPGIAQVTAEDMVDERIGRKDEAGNFKESYSTQDSGAIGLT